MKKINLYFIILLLLGLAISCNKVQEETGVEINQEGNNVGLTIKEISPLPSNLFKHTVFVTNKINYLEISPNPSESFMVSYQDSPIQAIYTPLNQTLKSSIEIFHVYFELEGKVSKFDLLISVEDISKSLKRFVYLTIEGDLIAQFDVGVDGLISNVQVNHLKDWGDRFENCVDWTFDHMNRWDKLLCMGMGPVCAGTIASMCAVGASEGMFETADAP